MSWKEVQFNKLDLTKQLLKESEAQVDALKKILKDKEVGILKAKRHLHQAKEEAMREYRDSDAFLKELWGSFVDGFDDYFCQVKASFPDLDLSHISIDAQAQTLTQPIYSEGIDELFTYDTNPDPQGDGDAIQVDKEKSDEDDARHLEGDQTVKEKAEDTLAVQSQFFFFICKFLAFDLLRELYPFSSVHSRCKHLPFCGLSSIIFIYPSFILAYLYVALYFQILRHDLACQFKELII